MPPGFLSVACRAPGSERDLSCLLSSSEATRGPEAPEGLAVTLMAQTYCSYLYLFASFIAAGLAASDLQSADHEEGVRHTGPSCSSPPPPSDVGTAQAGVLPTPVFIPSGRMVAHPEGVARTEQHAAPRHHYGPSPPDTTQQPTLTPPPPSSPLPWPALACSSLLGGSRRKKPFPR